MTYDQREGMQGGRGSTQHMTGEGHVSAQSRAARNGAEQDHECMRPLVCACVYTYVHMCAHEHAGVSVCLGGACTCAHAFVIVCACGRAHCVHLHAWHARMFGVRDCACLCELHVRTWCVCVRACRCAVTPPAAACLLGWVRSWVAGAGPCRPRGS